MINWKVSSKFHILCECFFNVFTLLDKLRLSEPLFLYKRELLVFFLPDLLLFRVPLLFFLLLDFKLLCEPLLLFLPDFLLLSELLLPFLLNLELFFFLLFFLPNFRFLMELFVSFLFVLREPLLFFRCFEDL